MRICVLGAGGVFGQNFAQYAKDQGHDVLGIGRSPRKPRPYSLDTDFPYIQRDLLSVEPWIQQFTETLTNPDVIVNFAAQAGLVPQSWKYPLQFYTTNTMLPISIAKNLPNCRYIHIGSSEVYGSVTAPASEDSPIKPSSPYAVSKAAADLHLMTLHDERITVVRPSNCYAEGQALYRLIPRAVLAGLYGPKINLQGNPQKSWMHADDLSRALLTLAYRRLPGLYNCGPELPTAIPKIVQMVAEACGKTLPEIAEVAEGRANEDACFWLSSAKLISATGWRPLISLQEGISRMVEWGRKYPEIASMSLEYEFRP